MSSRSTNPLPVPAFADPPKRVVVGLLGVVALSAVDGTIVATAMPRIADALGGLVLYAWVFAAFMLANTLATPVFGRYADRHGVKPCLLLGLAVFLAGSLLAGQAPDMAHLVAYRALQGAGVGGMATVSSVAFGMLYVPERRAHAQSLVSLVWGVASLAGPLVGGLMVTWWPWPWIFWVNVPLGLVATALVLGDLPAAVPKPPTDELAPKFQRLRRNPTFLMSLALAAIACAIVFPAINDMPLYVQDVLGKSAPEAGLVVTPMLVAWPAASALAGVGMNRLGFRKLAVAGAGLLTAGFALLTLASASWSLGASALLVGAGMGLLASTTLVSSQVSVPQHRLGAASAAIGVARNLGAAVGLVGLGQLQSLGRVTLAGGLQRGFEASIGIAVLALALALRMPAEKPAETARRGTQPL